MISLEAAGHTYTAIDFNGVIGTGVQTLPLSLRIMAENALRLDPTSESLKNLVRRDGSPIPFRPGRLLLQDMLGLPLLVDLMAMRTAIEEAGGDPTGIDLSLPVDLVIDHAMTVNYWSEDGALAKNMAREFEINYERFAFLKACEARFESLRVIPPGGGIMHQVNLEFLGTCVQALPQQNGPGLLVPDTNLGTDSHTPMINALGVLGWGIGGLEAENIIFGGHTTMNTPRVVGLEVIGTLDHRLTATDIALKIAEVLRAKGVVEALVEMFGSGYTHLSVPDRATIANMAPEYGCNSVLCPVDEMTMAYLKQTGRPDDVLARTKAYTKTQGLWFDPKSSNKIDFDDVVTLDLSTLTRSVAGPAKPEQRIDLDQVADTLTTSEEQAKQRRVPVAGADYTLGDGDVIIAAITSCTNTANVRNMLLAGLIARNAVARGLTIKPYVKASLAPGSRVVAHYLRDSGLQDALDALGFHIAAFACTTCNGMSGPLAPEHEAAIKDHDLNVAAVTSGNRNFPGRIHPLSSRNVITSPPLIVAYALAGSLLVNVETDPLGHDSDGRPVYLDDLWPDAAEITKLYYTYVTPDKFSRNYGAISAVNDDWTAMPVDTGSYTWGDSTNITRPWFLMDIPAAATSEYCLTGLRPLVILGDSVTTDHITPSGMIVPESAAGQYLQARGISQQDFNSYGTRRGCSDIVIRSTFANVRLQNEMVPGSEGSVTKLYPDGQTMSVFEAIEAYRTRGTGLVVIGGREYGCGSSRDTAAKAPWLAGIRAVVAESFERIHRSNLMNMGIAPLCFPDGVTRLTLGLDGSEVFDITLDQDLETAYMVIHRTDGREDTVTLDIRLYNDAEKETFRHGGFLHKAYRGFLHAEAAE